MLSFIILGFKIAWECIRHPFSESTVFFDPDDTWVAKVDKVLAVLFGCFLMFIWAMMWVMIIAVIAVMLFGPQILPGHK